MRVGRFPSMRDGGPTWYGVVCDTNPPNTDHWWSIMAGETVIPDYISKQEAKHHIRTFNQSAAIGFLPALRDAAHWVPKIHKELGYVFHCITSLSKDYSAQQLRKQNLEKIFGDTCFEKIICLDTGEDKDRILKEYQDSGYLWIEDKVQNAECGLKYGLDSVLFEHGFNMNNEQFKKYPPWESIYEDLNSL